jgi:hypothetical protein
MNAIADVLRQQAMHLLSVSVASTERDLKRATDLVVTVTGGDVAVRIRRPRYNGKWRDLTVRAWRKSGVKTERDKLIAGFADFYLYAWSDGDGGLADWFLVDLAKLRATELLTSKPIQYNRDGRTGFISIKDWELEQTGCLVADKQAQPTLQPALFAIG